MRRGIAALVLLCLGVAAAQDLPEGLDAPFYYDRLRAQKRLKELARNNPSILLKALSSNNPLILAGACRVAAQIQSKEAIKPLISLLSNPYPSVRKYAVEALKKYKSEILLPYCENPQELPELFQEVLAESARQTFLDYIEKRIASMDVTCYYPGLFKPLAKLGKPIHKAIVLLLKDALRGKVDLTGVTGTFILYAIGDLVVKEALPVLREIVQRRKKGRIPAVDLDMVASMMAILGDDSYLKERTKELLETRGKWAYGVVAHMWHQARRYEKAEEYYRKAIASSSNDWSIKGNFACVLSLMGKTKEAAEMLEEYIKGQKAGAVRLGERWKQWILTDGELANLRKSKWFKKLAEKYNIRPKKNSNGKENPDGEKKD